MVEKGILKFHDSTLSPKEFHSKLNNLYVNRAKQFPELIKTIWNFVTSREFAAIIVYWVDKAKCAGKTVTTQQFLRWTFGIEKRNVTDFCPAVELNKLLSGVGEFSKAMEKALTYISLNHGIDETVLDIKKFFGGKSEICVLYLILSRP